MQYRCFPTIGVRNRKGRRAADRSETLWRSCPHPFSIPVPQEEEEVWVILEAILEA